MVESARPACRPRLRPAPVLFLLAAWGLTSSAQPPPEPKKPADLPTPPPAKKEPKEPDLPALRLPDGTYLWLGAAPGASGERVVLTPQEYQKLVDQLDQLRKQLTARKPAAPSSCAVRGRVEKRGEQLVAVLRLTCTFRTAVPHAAVALGGRRGFLTSASLDGAGPPVLETTEDGFALTVETPGDHTVTLDLEAPVTTRGAKPELGFEIGLPRAPITTLVFDPPGPEVKRVNLTTRTPDPTRSGPPETRRLTVDLRQLAPQPGAETGLPVGPVDSLEVTWDPPAAAAPTADLVQSAEADITVLLTEGVVETTARVRLRGGGRQWKLLAPATADLTLERLPGPAGEVGSGPAPTITKPADPNQPVWKVELPAGSYPAEWMVVVVTRQIRPRPDDPRHRGPFPVGPFTVLDVLRQTGTIRVTAGPNHQFAFRHGPDVRRAEPPAAPDEDTTTALFRFTTGPTGSAPLPAPLLTVEAWPQPGRVTVRPSYRLTLRDGGWHVRAEVKVTPIRTEMDAVTVEVPAEWRGLEASPPELVVGVQPGSGPEGFWAEAAAWAAGGPRVPVLIRLAAAQKAPFDLVMTATVPADPTEGRLGLVLPRFPRAFEREAAAVVTVPEGTEVRAEYRGRGDELAAAGTPLTPLPGPDGQPPRVVSALSARSESGLARLLVSWNPHRPDLTADLHADVTPTVRQVEVVQTIRLRASEVIARPVRLKGPTNLAGLKSSLPLNPLGPGEWAVPLPPGSREATLRLHFAAPLDLPGADRVPVPLLEPTPATRTQATVRVWPGPAVTRAVSTTSPGWRELPPEPDPERSAFPALTLGASGGLPPLVLDVTPGSDNSAAAAWVERGLIQVWATEPGLTRYRAQFLLRRWLAARAEVRLPAPLAGPTPEFFRDGQRITPAVRADGPDPERTYYVPLPEARPGRTTVLEVRYQLPAEPGQTGPATYRPPDWPAAVFVGPVRWQVRLPASTVPLLTDGAAAEFRWRLRPTGLLPLPAGSEDDLERWFHTGDEGPGADPGAPDTLTARQSRPDPIGIYRVHQVALVIVASVVAFVLTVVLVRLPGEWAGPVVAVVAGGVGLAAVFAPHPVAHLAGACQPGLAAALVVLAVYAVSRRQFLRRLRRPPTFSWTPADSSGTLVPTPTPRGRGTLAGSSGTAAAAPVSG